MSELRALVREILQEELGRRQRPAVPAAQPVGEETVRISNDKDLETFALRVLQMAEGRDLRADIRAGRVRFRMTDGHAGGTLAGNAGGAAPVHFEKGLITERDIARLEDGVGGISLGKSVCLTPLARDELRRKGLKIERKAS